MKFSSGIPAYKSTLRIYLHPTVNLARDRESSRAEVFHLCIPNNSISLGSLQALLVHPPRSTFTSGQALSVARFLEQHFTVNHVVGDGDLLVLEPTAEARKWGRGLLPGAVREPIIGRRTAYEEPDSRPRCISSVFFGGAIGAVPIGYPRKHSSGQSYSVHMGRLRNAESTAARYLRRVLEGNCPAPPKESRKRNLADFVRPPRKRLSAEENVSLTE